VNIGICWLVSLAVTFSTTPTEVDNAVDSNADEVGTLMLSVGVDFRLGATEDVATALEISSVVEKDGGVIYEVEKRVCGSCVTSGSPSGLTKVIAGAIDVKIVCWIGSTMMAVSASATCFPEVGEIAEVVLT
jgi:hypothetical protein